MTRLSLDYETFGELDIKRVGLDAYMEHASFHVLMGAYRIDRGPLQHWEAHRSPVPAELRDALLDPNVEKWAYHAAFERLATIRGLEIATPIEGWRCTQVLAYMHSFMGRLGDVGEQMCVPLDARKQKIGDRLIRIFCRPQKPTKAHPYVRRDWSTDPEDWHLFCEYNRVDVIAEEAIRDPLLAYPALADEWDFYHLDQRINDRGMPFDRLFAENIMALSEGRRDELLAVMRELTGLKNPNSQPALLAWLQSHGYEFDDIGQHTVTRALVLHGAGAMGLSETCVEVLKLRQVAARAATKKAQAALRMAGADDRIRYMFQFGGASRTQRFAGRGVQSQNMERTPKLFDPEKSSERLDVVTKLIRQGDRAAFDLLVDEPMAVYGGVMRGMFRARDGYKLHICDYSSIESVGLAWVAKCQRMLDVFWQGRDIYRDFGTAMYKKLYEQITGAERQICKPATLGCGYGLGPGKVLEDGTMTGLLAYAAAMHVEMTPAEAVAAVRAYRDTYTEVVDLWYACDRAANYVLEDHQPREVGPIVFDWHKPFLLVRLPSGRCIYYHKPRMEWREIRTGKKVWNEETQRMEEETYMKHVLTFMGRNQRNTKWDRIAGRGAHLVENIVQALTRDILKVGMMRLDAEGFPIIGHAHDEVIIESRVGDNYYTWERMREIMTRPIEWLPDFPLGAAGWSGAYYRK